MAFKSKIAEMIAYRAAYICSNPCCNTLTIGPSHEDTNLKNKKGEAAHIYGEKNGAARYLLIRVLILKVSKTEFGFAPIAIL